MKDWSKKRKQVIFAGLISILTVTLTGGVYAAEQGNSSSLSSAEQEKQQLESALHEAQGLISELQNSQEDAETKIAELDQKMSDISGQMTSLEQKLDDKSAEISNTETLLAQSQENAAAQYESMKLRIQYMYENAQSMSYMELLCTSGSVSDFLNSVDYVYELSEYDRNMLEQYQNTTQLVADTKAQLEQDYADLETMQGELQDQKNAVAALRGQKETELASIGSQLDTAEDTALTYENEIAAQEEVISEIKTQLAIQAQREAERKAAAEAARKQAEEAARKQEEDAAESGTETATGENSSDNTGSDQTGSDSTASDYVEPPTYTGGVFTWPCPSSRRVTSEYGNRISPTAGASSSHKGIDIGASYGADIVAAADGEVIYSGYSAAAGNHVIISHGNGLCTVYMHASALNVSVGDIVSAGQSIAKVGSTGISTGNHLHFGVSLNGAYVSPWDYL